MDEALLRKLYEDRGLPGIEEALEGLRPLDWERLDAEGVRRWIRETAPERDLLLAAARYARIAGRHEAYVFLLRLAEYPDLYEALAERTEALAGKAVREEAFGGLPVPGAGTLPEDLPAVTSAMVAALERALDGDRKAVEDCLTANAHGIPDEAFADEPRLLAEAPSIQAWLDGGHRRAVEVLDRHAESGEPWFEQIVTPAVVEWVGANPEVLGGVRDGSRILLTKIPYDPDAWLSEADPTRRRYLYCHCPLARESLAGGGGGVDPSFCRCSAGFAKRKFDVAFGEETEIEVLESVMAGDDRCRFSIGLPGAYANRK